MLHFWTNIFGQPKIKTALLFPLASTQVSFIASTVRNNDVEIQAFPYENYAPVEINIC